ncbi:DEAD/DEAH box helicase [Paenibacillus sp. ACRRX]|uniref:DEAD/DEAH box helicase n=1 Tax=unclassified Paenibacillus TaxID=185978 RepID=UPI001EF48A33|nr:DEAD/DEAH box helicase [Paenibacillus sp. UMB4589-SE434]MCG7410038.1 DEAD/DEAH box helicase [Paenibacillus sp. ACRRX]MDK8183988.1 DEAD/DEAH box helicase [Paenibacillus sp. UMB4589-SE434]
MTVSFTDLQVDAGLVERLQARDIHTASPIQAEAIPAALQGKDVLAQSQTGTGKTFAYLLPLIMRLQADEKRTQAAVIAPTQELAMQIVREAEALLEGSDTIVQPLIGGAALHRQVDKLKLRPQLVVGTPGRIRELVEMKKLKIHEVNTIVVDEVDHVLQKGGASDTDIILNRAKRDRQLLFFSATLPADVKRLAEKWMHEPVAIGIEPDKRVADSIEHLFFVTEERDKIDLLRRLVRHWKPKQAIVFVNDSQMIGEWESKLSYTQLSVGSLYGDAPKQERVNVLRRFREGEFQLLLATDVAARGLDIPELPYVFSLQPALNAEHYVHRSGRTGRMGRQGVSVSIITERERFIIRKFERELHIPIKERSFYDGRISEAEADHLRAKPRTAKPSFTSDKPSREKVVRDKGSNGRHRDRKNKGAPKWLKEKQNQPKPE